MDAFADYSDEELLGECTPGLSDTAFVRRRRFRARIRESLSTGEFSNAYVVGMRDKLLASQRNSWTSSAVVKAMTFCRLVAFAATASTLLAWAGASAHANDIPAGHVEHTITTRTFVHLARHYKRTGAVIVEDWVGSTASRELITDTATHRAVQECVTTGTTWSCWYRKVGLMGASNVVETCSGPNPFSGQSWSEQAKSPKELARESYHKVGVSSILGRPTVIYRNRLTGVGFERKPAVMSSMLDIDRATGYTLRSTMLLRSGRTRFRQTETVTTFETVDESTVSFAMSPHKGATSEGCHTHFGTGRRRG